MPHEAGRVLISLLAVTQSNLRKKGVFWLIVWGDTVHLVVKTQKQG